MWYDLAGKTSVWNHQPLLWISAAPQVIARETRLFTLPLLLPWLNRDIRSCFLWWLSNEITEPTASSKRRCLSSVFLSSKGLSSKLPYEDLSQFCFEMLTHCHFKKYSLLGLLLIFINHDPSVPLTGLPAFNHSTSLVDAHFPPDHHHSYCVVNIILSQLIIALIAHISKFEGCHSFTVLFIDSS